MSNKVDWYLPNLQSGDVIGPLTFEEIDGMLSKGQLKVDDWLWGSHLKTLRWYRVFELPEFEKHLVKPPHVKLPRHLRSRTQTEVQQQVLTLNFSGEGEYRNKNQYRRHPRAPLEVQVLVHDHQNLLRGRSVDISEKGVMVVLPKEAPFEKGTEVILTFRGVPYGIGTFSTAAVALRVIPEGNENQYGFFFLRINPKVRRAIARYIMKTLAEESTQEKAA